MDKVKEVIKTMVDSNNIQRILFIYDEELKKNNNETYFLTHFTKEKFAQSLCKSFEELKNYYDFQPDVFNKIKEKIFNIGMDVFKHDYVEKGESIQTIREIQKIANVVIYTVGDRLEQVRKIAKLGLTDIPFEIYDHKDETLFRNLKLKYSSNKYMMIGDSEFRDILPAKNTNFDAIFHITTKKYTFEPNIHVIDKIEDLLTFDLKNL
jgi:FMN phosphatase YigB (HAD superfamily)